MPPRKPTTAEEGTASVRRQFFRHPSLQSGVRISAREVVGNAELAWYRGRQAGLDEAALWLEEHYEPKVGRAFRKDVGLNEDGDMEVKDG